MAAARIALLPLSAIRDRLGAQLPLPGTGPRDVPARQRTLGDTVAWSHDLLSPSLQTVMQDLSVFEGGFDLAQATEVVTPDRTGQGDALDDLLGLVENSLVARDRPEGDAIRFRLLRTIGDVARARLTASGREAVVRRRHAQAYLDLATEAARHDASEGQDLWMTRLDSDHANLRSAVRWSIDSGKSELALLLVGRLWRYWQTKGHLSEGRPLAAEALAMPGAIDRPAARVGAVAAAGNIAYWQGDAIEARRWYLEQAASSRAIGDEAALADATFNLASVEFLENADEATLRAVAEDAERRFRDLGDMRGVARAQWAKPILAMQEGRADEARDGLEALLAEFERLGDARYHAMTKATLAWAAFNAGDFPTACRWAVDGIEETFRLGDLGSATISLHIGVLMAAMIGRVEDAARLTGAFDALTERYGVRPPAALGRLIDQVDPFAMARDALSPESYAAAYEMGRRMTLEQAVALTAAVGSAVSQPQ